MSVWLCQHCIHRTSTSLSLEGVHFLFQTENCSSFGFKSNHYLLWFVRGSQASLGNNINNNNNNNNNNSNNNDNNNDNDNDNNKLQGNSISEKDNILLLNITKKWNYVYYDSLSPQSLISNLKWAIRKVRWGLLPIRLSYPSFKFRNPSEV